MSADEIGKKYVALVKAGKREEVLATLFSQDAVSVEPFPPPGRDRISTGIEALRGKSKFFLENNLVHRDDVTGPYPHGDRFAVRFVFETTFKPTGQRRTRDEIGLFTIVDGKIVREEFFYPQG